MTSTAISNEDYTSLCPDQKGSNDTQLCHHIVLSSLKSFVRLRWMDNFQHHTDVEYGQCGVENQVAESKISSSSKTLVALVVLAFITVMVLLLLWNYKCIMIDKVCEGNSDLLTPVFKED